MKSNEVRPKKHLGQHFLEDESIAKDIVDLLRGTENQWETLIEIGPGTGVLTKYLLERYGVKCQLMDVDNESVTYLKKAYPQFKEQVVMQDFLQVKFAEVHKHPTAVIGNFPYNISSQIFFRVLDDYNDIPVVVCMLQREVAKRLASPPGNKDYGILSVLLQVWYDIKYNFTVDEHVFNPPPKVKSGVITLTRNQRTELPCQWKDFKTVVKQGFNNRRKTLRNALSSILSLDVDKTHPLFDKRAEQLSVEDFIELTLLLKKS